MNIKDILFIISVIIIITAIFTLAKKYIRREHFSTDNMSKEAIQNISSYMSRGYIIYPGTIIMWYGDLANIPEGYVLCDGNNGTPDLRNKFVVGAGSDYKMGSIGGNNSITLSVDQLPPHNHSGSGTTDVNEINPKCTRNGGDGDGYLTGKNNSSSKCHPLRHQHQFKLTTDNTGNNTPIDIRPPFYALYFIMKTWN